MSIRQLGFALAVGLALAAGHAGAADNDTVHVAQGDLKGATAGAVTSFKGIPFAAPPVGDLRWRPPAPAASWTGARDATAFGPSCMQPLRGPMKMAISEDCLTLNVWTPTDRKPGDKLAVMVWIYGGAFVSGSGSLPFYAGTHFAEHGVVLVTLNYRLGHFGFFAHPALAKESPDGPIGNYGLMDQIAALKWVKANIAAFGGDASNVTIFGESAGGISVNYLLGSPAARGLFDKAISESGFGRLKAPMLAGAQGGHDAETIGLHIAASLGVTGEGPEALAALRALPADKVNTPFAGLSDPEAPTPMLDGVIVKETIAQSFERGHQAHVPYLEGGNSYEASLFSNIAKDPEPTLARTGPARAKVMALYDSADPVKVATGMTTDNMITEPDRFLAREDAKAGVPVFVYHFSYVPAAQRATSPGAPHGGRISYVFSNLLSTPMTFGPITLPAATDEDRKIGASMTSYWVAFAKTGDPDSAGGPRWPAYTVKGDDLMEFGADGPKVRHAFAKARLDWLESVAGDQ